MNATVQEEIHQRRVSSMFQPADLCDRERNRFSSVVALLNVALQVNVDEFKDQV